MGTACDDGSVELWDIHKRVLQHSFIKAHTLNCTSLTFSAVNQMLLCSGGLDKKMMFYDTMDKRIVKQVICSGPLTSLSFHSDGYTIAAGTFYGTILLFDLRSSMDPVKVLEGHANNSVNDIEFARGSKTKTLKVPPKTKEIGQSLPAKNTEIENTSTVGRGKWKSIDEVREEAKRNVERRAK